MLPLLCWMNWGTILSWSNLTDLTKLDQILPRKNKNTGNSFYKVKRHQLKEVEPQKKLRLQRSARRRKRLEVTMRRVGGDSQDSREHFNCNATSVRRSSSLFAFLALAGDCGGCWQCSWRSAMQEWRCKCCQCDKREGGEEEEELLALSRCCTARCSGPRNVKVCRRRKKLGDSLLLIPKSDTTCPHQAPTKEGGEENRDSLLILSQIYVLSNRGIYQPFSNLCHLFFQRGRGGVLDLTPSVLPSHLGCNFRYLPLWKKNVDTLPRVGMNWKICRPRTSKFAF